MAFTCISYTVENGVALCKLNRPDKLNSLSLLMVRELGQAIESASVDSSVRAVLLAAEGRGFCAGQDISEVSAMLSPGQEAPDLGKVLRDYCNPLVRTIRSMGKPVVCAVNGVAAGAGANLALCCDIILAAKDAYFVQAFAKIGLIPDYGGSFLLPRLIGLGRATALAMLAEKLPAEEAQRMGLVYRVCETDSLFAEASQVAAYLATQPTRGLGLTKRAFNASLDNTFEQQLTLEEDLQRQAGNTADFKEGVQAFFEKRQPHFTGA